MNRFQEFHSINNNGVYGRNYNLSNEKVRHVPPSFLVDSSSPLSSVSIPSPPSISPTPETYNKQDMYQNVEYLKVAKSSNCPSPSTVLSTDAGEAQLQQTIGLVHSMRELKQFLLTAPSQFRQTDVIHQFKLPTEEQISCVRWNRVYCITGTDIVRILAYRFSVFGRDVVNRKKFEEGVFSDLRNLKINVDATLENPKSELLEFLYKRHCVRTKKKQKVFFWYSVHHDQLFIDALERELKKDIAANDTEVKKGCLDNVVKEGAQLSSTISTIALREPALSFRYDPSSPLSEQLSNSLSELPTHFSDLVVEITTSNLDSKHRTNENGVGAQEFYPPPTSHSVPWYNDQMHAGIHSREVFDGNMQVGRNNNRFQANIEYPVHPSTPLQSNGRKLNLETSLMLTPYDKQSHSAVYSQHKENAGHSSPATDYSSRYQTPPKSITQQIHTPSIMPGSNESTSKSYDHCATLSSLMKFSDEPSGISSDFPLDVLVKEDESTFRSGGSDFGQSFDTKYTDFAHHNRPALSSQNRHTLWVQNNHPQSPVSQSLTHAPLDTPLLTYHLQPHPPVGGSSGAPPPIQPHVLAPQSPDWDQFIYSDPLSANRLDHPSVLSSPFQPYASLTRSSGHTRDMLNQKLQGRVAKQTHTRQKESQAVFPTYLHDEC